jgi:hypothetical protein
MTSKALIATTVCLLIAAALTIAAFVSNREKIDPASSPDWMVGVGDRPAVPSTGPPSVPETPAAPGTQSPPPPDTPAIQAPPPVEPAPAPAPAAPKRRPASPKDPADEAPAAPGVPPSPAPASGGLAVAEAALCKDIDRDDRKPLNPATEFRVRDGRIWCFMKLTGGANRKVRTVWYLGGRSYPGTWLKAGTYGAPSWRTWAYKLTDDSLVGDGRVEIVDEKGTVLRTLSFQLVK